MKVSRKFLIVIGVLWAVTFMIALQPGLLYRDPQLPRPTLGYPLRPRTLIVLLATPFVYAFIYHQRCQSPTSMVLDTPLMEEDFKERPSGTEPFGWEMLKDSLYKVEFDEDVMHHQGDNSDG